MSCKNSIVKQNKTVMMLEKSTDFLINIKRDSQYTITA